MIVLFILLCFISGLFIINIFNKKIDLSTILILSIPLGVVLHTVIFLFLSFLNIYYNKYMFIIISLLTLLLFIKKRIKVINDLKNIPIYYIIFVGYVIVRLLVMAATGFIETYNFDEFTAYQTGSTITYLSHNFNEIYQTFAPINYLIGTMSLEFVGLSINAARIISVIFFALTSLFIFKSLSENKVNRHISALLSMLFLISSSEMLRLAKSFYTNVFFMTYFIIGVYGIIHYYFIKKEKGIPYVYFLMIIGMMLTRRETMYLALFVLVIISIIVFIKKMITKKELIIINLPLLFPFIWRMMEKIYSFTFGFTNSDNTDSIIERLLTRLDGSNLSLFLDNAYTQTFSNDMYYYNNMLFIVFAITIFIFIYKLFKNKKDKYVNFSFFILLFEFAYIGVVILTEFLVFSIVEFQLAASFSRYIISVLGINFIILGCLLYHDTEKEKNSVSLNSLQIRKIKKISNPKILFIIPAYNEELNIVKIIDNIKLYNKDNNTKYDYVVINDGSTDNTENLLIKNKINHVQLVYNLGIGGAVQTGYKYAYENNYDVAVQFDGDGQHDINSANKIIKPIIDGKADLVIGSRFIEKNSNTFKSSFLRRVGIKLISFTMKIVTKKEIYDTTSGFRACNKDIISQFSKHYPVEYPEPISTVSMLKKGYIVDEVQVNMNERKNGVSSIKSWKSVYYMINVFLSIVVVGIRRNK